MRAHTNSKNAYLENEVLTLSPLALVVRVQKAAQTAVAAARRHLEAGDQNACRNHINRARALVTELRAALDHEQGGEIAERLEALYEFICTCLLRPSAHPDPRDLGHAEALIKTIEEGFHAILARESPAVLA